MTRRTTTLLTTLALAIPILAAVPLGTGTTPAATDVVGPPWISLEYPANPHHPDTRGALALVHTYHHGDPRDFGLTGRAIGMVCGERVERPLQLRSTYRPGVYAVRGDLPDGAWVLAMDMNDREASMLVALDPAGSVAAVRVPGTNRDGWFIPRAATAADVEALLRTTVAVAAAAATED